MMGAAGVAPRASTDDFQAALESIGLHDTPALAARLAAYVDLLAKWNRTYNLTAIRDPQQMLVQHLLDSLAILPVLQTSGVVERRSTSVADVGSGAGLPAIPLALARPDWSITAIEPSGKKAAFQRQAKIELGLLNLEVIEARAENVVAQSFDLVVSRAFASLHDFVLAAGQLAGGGVLCAMKGRVDVVANEVLPPPWRLSAVLPVHVPMLDAERHLVLLRKS